jgi:predicted amidohydrolase YtcJ
MNALAARRLDLSGHKSAAAVLDAVKDALASGDYDEGGRTVGVNVKTGKWSEADTKLLTRAALDALSPTKPLVLIFNGYHSAMCNTPALEFHGVQLTSAFGEEHSGMLLEKEAFDLQQRLQGAADDAILDKWVQEQAHRAASLGVTEIVDLEMAHNLPSWTRRVAAGFDTLRVHIGFYLTHVADAEIANLHTGAPVEGCNGLITAGPLKLITDGSLGSQTAYCCDCYPGTDDRGILVFGAKEIEVAAIRGHEAGLRLAFHAIGDDALRETLTALEAAAHKGCPPLPGSTIEHAQLVHVDDLPRFAALGLTASIQPRHLVDDREMCVTFWPGRESRTYAFKSIVDAGIPIRLGSDCPVAPLQPWDALACAISRAAPGDEPFVGEQIIPLDVAYAASTHNGKLTITEGEAADIVILHDNPLECDAAGLRAMVVEGTMLEGRWTYRRTK